MVVNSFVSNANSNIRFLMSITIGSDGRLESLIGVNGNDSCLDTTHGVVPSLGVLL